MKGFELIQNPKLWWQPQISVGEGGNANVYINAPSLAPAPPLPDAAPLDWLRAQVGEVCQLARAA